MVVEIFVTLAQRIHALAQQGQLVVSDIATISGNFVASSLIFQCAVLAYNTIRWMALLSNNKQLKRWEVQTVRTYLIRTAGKLLTGGKQLRLNVPDQHLHAAPWEAWLKLSFI